MEKCTQCFAVHCGLDGRVTEVIHDADQILPPDIAGSMLLRIVVPGDLNKYLNFFLQLSSVESAIAWEINVITRSGPETFSFFGGVFNDQIGIAAAKNHNGAKLLFNELTRINNEQTNLIRSITKENARLQKENGEPEVSYFEEMSRLNNELVNMQRELSKKNQELAELNILKNQFLGIAAHDLRSPIGVIMSYSELLSEQGNSLDESERKQIIERINGIGNFMFNMVNDLLDISNIESGKLELNLTEEDMSEVIRNVVSQNRIFARGKEMILDFVEPSYVVSARIDRPKIEQVLTNYLTNAMKFSHAGSSVRILLEVDETRLRVSVCDEGQGIRADELDRLFKPFEKTSTRSTAGEKSTGLGLLIVKKIIEAHQGEVGVKSIYGKGSVFSFSLPVSGT